jgi:hypothetical protein
MILKIAVLVLSLTLPTHILCLTGILINGPRGTQLLEWPHPTFNIKLEFLQSGPAAFGGAAVVHDGHAYFAGAGWICVNVTKECIQKCRRIVCRLQYAH